MRFLTNREGESGGKPAADLNSGGPVPVAAETATDADRELAVGAREGRASGAELRAQTTIGSQTRNVVPLPCADSSSIRPPCFSTTARAIERPRPLPGIAFFWAAEDRKNRLKIWPLSAAGIPIPVSRTSITAQSASAFRRTSTRPPSGVNLTAL